MATSWWQDFGKALLVVAGLALVTGYLAEMQAGEKPLLARFTDFLATPGDVSTAPAVPAVSEPVKVARAVPAANECRPRVAYLVVRRPTCGPVMRSCH
ncbi:MAG: hypothetical protein U0929_01760 [Planctomycetaceae bacterium]